MGQSSKEKGMRLEGKVAIVTGVCPPVDGGRTI